MSKVKQAQACTQEPKEVEPVIKQEVMDDDDEDFKGYFFKQWCESSAEEDEQKMEPKTA